MGVVLRAFVCVHSSWCARLGGRDGRPRPYSWVISLVVLGTEGMLFWCCDTHVFHKADAVLEVTDVTSDEFTHGGVARVFRLSFCALFRFGSELDCRLI